MILDHIDHAARYHALHPRFAQAFAYLLAFDPATPEGRHEIAGDNLFALVQRYRTDPCASKSWESHLRYGDIQYLHAGSELCGYADSRALLIDRPYDSGKDVAKHVPATGHPTRLSLAPGQFAIFFPGEAHQPSVTVQDAVDVVKVVVKFLY